MNLVDWDFCKNCGKVIVFEEFEAGEWGWLHPHTGFLDCGNGDDPDGFDSDDAEPYLMEKLI